MTARRLSAITGASTALMFLVRGGSGAAHDTGSAARVATVDAQLKEPYVDIDEYRAAARWLNRSGIATDLAYLTPTRIPNG